MSLSAIFLAFEVSMSLSFVHPPTLHLQSPGFGKLVIQSNPPGATIRINDRQQKEPTDFTYGVGQGIYKVSVTGGPGGLHCDEKTVTVNAGSTVTVMCTTNGWQ